MHYSSRADYYNYIIFFIYIMIIDIFLHWTVKQCNIIYVVF